MPHFSDDLHMDTCAGRNCNVLLLRSSMARIEGRRGWFCDRCQKIWPPKKKNK